MAPKENEQERREVIRRVQYRDQELQRQAAQAQAELDHAKAERDKIKDALSRAESPFPAGDICPECWIMHGEARELRAVPHPDSKHFDRWICRACGHTRDREA